MPHSEWLAHLFPGEDDQDTNWPKTIIVGKQELLHCVRSVPSCSLSHLCFAHRLFQTAKIGSLVGIQDSEDPEGSWVFCYLVQSEGVLSALCFPKRESWIIPLYPFLTVLHATASRPDQKDPSTLCLCTDPSSQPQLPALLWRLSSLRPPLCPRIAGYLYVYDYLPPVSPRLPQLPTASSSQEWHGQVWTSSPSALCLSLVTMTDVLIF